MYSRSRAFWFCSASLSFLSRVSSTDRRAYAPALYWRGASSTAALCAFSGTVPARRVAMSSFLLFLAMAYTASRYESLSWCRTRYFMAARYSSW